MEISLDDYLNQCGDKWKGNNIRLWIVNKCEKENLDFNNYDIYKNIVKEMQKRE